jgi:hypothetical protein
MMAIEPGAVVVIALFGLSLYVILFVSPRLAGGARDAARWWRSSWFWASFVAIAQIVVYALFS